MLNFFLVVTCLLCHLQIELWRSYNSAAEMLTCPAQNLEGKNQVWKFQFKRICAASKLFKIRENLNPFWHGDICVPFSLCSGQILQWERTVDKRHAQSVSLKTLIEPRIRVQLPAAGAWCAHSPVESSRIQSQTWGCAILPTHKDGTLRLLIACTPCSRK